MKKNGWFFLVASLFIFMFFSFVSALTAGEDNSSVKNTIERNWSAGLCVSDYKCGEFGPCVDNSRTRICDDIKCGRALIMKYSPCLESCESNLVCGEWDSCTYGRRTEDVFERKIGFVGYKQRECTDTKNCIHDFLEEEPCREITNVVFRPAEECGQKVTNAYEENSDRVIATIKTSKNGALQSLVFVQGEREYCAS